MKTQAIKHKLSFIYKRGYIYVPKTKNNRTGYQPRIIYFHLFLEVFQNKCNIRSLTKHITFHSKLNTKQFVLDIYGNIKFGKLKN